MLSRLICFLLLLCSVWFARAGEEQDYPHNLAGEWQGKGRVYKGHIQTAAGDSVKTDSVFLSITLHRDGAVTGHIGGAQFIDCRHKRNRGWLGRLLNIKTDYIIKGGHLKGPIVPADSVDIKEFTIPFNLTDGKIKGTCMWLRPWKYPDPLVRVIISRKMPNYPLDSD